MALLKLKVEDREKLYYSKFAYKATCYVVGAFYAHYSKTIDECLDKINTLRNQYGTRFPTHIPANFGDSHIKQLTNLIEFINNFNDNNLGTIRREGNYISFFSNDLCCLESLVNVTENDVGIFQVNLTPAGIKYFKREVPAPYRVYFKDNKVPSTIRAEIIDYLERTDNTEGSKSLMIWLHREMRWPVVWSSPQYYINYHNESDLTMMHLLFSEVIGKNYKLEKK